MTAIAMVDEVFGPGVWECRNRVKAIIANHAMAAPKYADLGNVEIAKADLFLLYLSQ
jgi:hypothetical protein